MVDSIVNFYKENVSSYALVFKYCKWVYRLFTLAMYLFAFSLVPIIIVFSINKYKIIGITIAISLIIFAGFMLFFLNFKAKKIIKAKYNIASNKWFWYSEAFDTMQEELFIKYLKMKGLFSDTKLKHLVLLLKDEAKRNRLPPFIAPGILLAFSIPAWVQFISIVYKSLSTIELAAAVTIGIFFVILIIVECIGICKIVYNDAIDPIINRKSYLIEKALYLINITILRLPDK